MEKCPDEIMSPYLLSHLNNQNPQDIKQEIKPYCDIDLYESNPDKSLEEVMADQICPEWFVKSQPFLGRCIPFMKKNNISNPEDIFEGDGWVSYSRDNAKCVTQG